MATIEEVEDGTKLTAEINGPSDLAVAYPELKIEDYLEPPVARIAREELNNPENHLHTHKRLKNVSPAFVLRNNGSIN